MPLFVNPKDDAFPIAPAGRYGPKDSATLNRLFMGPSRFTEEDGSHRDVLKAEVSFQAADGEGGKQDFTLTEEFGRGVLDVLRNLGQDMAELTTDGDGLISIPTDAEENVIVGGQTVEGWDVEFTVTARKRGGRTYNNIRGLRLPSE